MSFPFTLQNPVEHGGAPPSRTGIVVIGGGVIGVATALYLARVGHDVALLEKGRIAAEQSSRNWGWIRVQGRDMAEIPVAQDAQRLWQDLDRDCKGRLGLREIGVHYLTRSEKSLANYANWLEAARAHGVSSKLMSAKDIAETLPGAASDWIGGLYTPTDMKAEPWVAVPELARLAAQEGARIVERCATRALDIEAGRVVGVVTERGRVKADAVVLAGGAWSALLLRRHGVTIPQLSVRSTALETGPMPQVTGTAGVDDRMAFRPREDGGYTLAPSTLSELYLGPDALRATRKYLPVLRQGGFEVKLRARAPEGYPDAWSTPRQWSEDQASPFEAMRILSPEPNRDKAASAAAAFAAAFPEAGEVGIRTAWAGMIDVLPDVVPVVDQVAPLPGLVVATGMCGHGFGAGPAFGRIAAALATGETPGHDLDRFRFGRFSDGSRMVPGPNL
ncbi:4-methylaminobutanoate oxidase (formaldehyde-forming) [Roseivivax sp. THAF40]|uniref:NAD(P)/FAD-dependent oxidoreductase n=1 Tax=unclassified Roseivivax TaxID=2639302 RepID=UPI0012696B70|nr:MULTISPECIES: FAD-binding oxidoreductase [unclassified Roseivivax]QFS82146.1 4-methylaminobutanoate oxidase (formaldehyde-forming) [Roseivivax sp. THAF197b]QFT45946.1 4-methylaminobutanoate oxidase (formaldehyde-forming) [Roseivivax sp. THAF40]